jgi:sugar phosphate isomerase/epimerase
MTWTLTGFADEIADDVDVQLATLRAANLRYLELRSAWGTNVADFSSSQLHRLEESLRDAGVGVSAIGSPIGKIPVGAPLGPELDRLRRVAGTARQLRARIVRVFSFFIPGAEDPSRYRQQVIDRMGALAGVASEEGVVLAHENEKGVYGDRPERCQDLLVSVGSPALRATFDAANFVQCGVRPHSDAYELIRPHLLYLQVKDASLATGEVVPAGQGDGQVRQTLAALRDSGFDGFLSVEPHLAADGRFGRLTGPERFRLAVSALEDLLRELSVPWA